MVVGPSVDRWCWELLLLEALPVACRCCNELLSVDGLLLFPLTSEPDDDDATDCFDCWMLHSDNRRTSIDLRWVSADDD